MWITNIIIVWRLTLYRLQ